MAEADLASIYRSYIACLNARDWAQLGRFVGDDVQHNGRTLGLSGYRDMLEQDVAAIPDLRFAVRLLMVEPPHVGCRLAFDCTPRTTFLGIPVNGRRVSFTENVFYRFRKTRITQVWSVIDTAAIEAQLQEGSAGTRSPK